jgi:predicted RNA binding protein YcfA (HicA-like mRNA interferase family)
MAVPKDIAKLMKEAEKQGWTVSMTKGDHFKWMSPLGGLFYSSQTPTDHRAINNLKRDLRVNGFIELNRKKGKR